MSPVFLIIAVIIKSDSKGPVIYRQTRVGKDGKDFELYKFRSMKTESDKHGLLTVGGRDPRITGSGYILRKYKLDELPQLANVFKGDMSFVGPRPEVRRYTELYDENQKKVLSIRPGLTDLASLKYFDEQKLLGESDDPEKTYRNEIMPKKLDLNLQYLAQQSLFLDFKLIFSTIFRIFK